MGYYYENIENEVSLYNKFKIDKRFVDKYGVKKENNLYNDNEIILMNVLDVYNPSEHFIYINNLLDEINYITKEKRLI